MPERPLKPCPRCGILIRDVGLCVRCDRAKRKRIDAQRPTSTQRGYDRAWRAIRDQVVRERRVCEHCGLLLVDDQGEPRPYVSCVDHRDGNTANNDPSSNLRAMCKLCHDARTMRDQVPYG